MFHPRQNSPKRPPEIWVERFGSEIGPLYLTIFNGAKTPQTARLTLQSPLKVPVALRDLVSGKNVASQSGVIEISLESEQTAVLKLR